MLAILSALEASGLKERVREIPFSAARAEDLCLVHEPAYVELVRRACEEGFLYIGDRDTHLCRESFDVAALAAGGVLAACDAVWEGVVERAFCAVRPPGHHAGTDRALGFCVFNHVALGAEHLVRRRGAERVAIVDFDVHHGNGTQDIFAGRNDVLYVSLHEHPLSLKFPGTGFRNEAGTGAGAGYTRNVFLPHGCDGEQYLATVRSQTLPLLREFGPQVLLLSAGFDGQCTESIAHLTLRPADFAALTTELLGAVARTTAGRTVSALEGGYELAGLAACAAAHVGALLGDVPPGPGGKEADDHPAGRLDP